MLKFFLLIGLSTCMVVSLPNLREQDFCLTTYDSVIPEEECIFPFKHDNITYYGCPIDPIDETRRWCSTLIDDNGVHVNSKWGYCTPGCKPAEGIEIPVDVNDYEYEEDTVDIIEDSEDNIRDTDYENSYSGAKNKPYI